MYHTKSLTTEGALGARVYSRISMHVIPKLHEVERTLAFAWPLATAFLMTGAALTILPYSFAISFVNECKAGPIHTFTI